MEGVVCSIYKSKEIDSNLDGFATVLNLHYMVVWTN